VRAKARCEARRGGRRQGPAALETTVLWLWKNSLAKTPGADIIFPTKIEHGASGMPLSGLARCNGKVQ
jgi:hypothetical protein